MSDRVFQIGMFSIMLTSMVMALCWSRFDASPLVSGIALITIPVLIFGWTYLCNTWRQK